MATKRKKTKPSKSPRTTRKPSGRTVPRQARMLFTQLSVQYADADAAEWDDLREHLDTQMGLLAGGSTERRQRLVEEFEKVRTETLAAQQTRRLRLALHDGLAELTRDRGDGLEEWQVVVGEETVRIYVPAQDPSLCPKEVEALDVARRALLSGWCPSCRLGVDLVAGFAELTHNPRCPGKDVLGF